MNGAAARYDVAVVGAGPVGSFCALLHARKGARVALLEANPKASRRLAGEWLHPPAVRMLRDAGIRLDREPASTVGRGFAVYPEDRSAPIVLPYGDGSNGLTCEHARIVSNLREAIGREAGIDYIPHARVREIEDGRVGFSCRGEPRSLGAARIVGADGRASVVRRSLGAAAGRTTCSRMVGLIARGATLPLPGYGHVLLGGPGQILMYGLGEGCVRVILDVPPQRWTPRHGTGLLADSYAPFLPETVRPAFLEAVRAGRFDAAANELRPRFTYGTARRVLIGDAAGHYHPMTAVGMTLGFADALALAEAEDFDDFTARRRQAARAPELLAMGLYEIFADHRPEAVALRRATYRRWRASSAVRRRTTRLLACEDTSTTRLGLTFFGLAARALARELPGSCSRRAWRRSADTAGALAVRLGWCLRGLRQLVRADAPGARPTAGGAGEARTRASFSRAFLTSMPVRAGVPGRPADAPDAAPALERATGQLLKLQADDGGWEGEMVWCPMLTAQYVLLHHIIGRPLEPGRRRRVLRSFEHTRIGAGLWGLHRHAAPHLFVTTLVYVAARLLGVPRGDPLVEPARRFLRSEGVAGIPSWGKFWLALLNLYPWRGLNPLLPELWNLPRRVPLHPSNWYCHTRLIFLAMSAIYPQRFQAPVTPAIASLRDELYSEGFGSVDFTASRNRLREADLFARPGVWLRLGYEIARLFERFHAPGLRRRCIEDVLRRIRWELRTTSHTSISPVSGLLNILALWLRDPADPDMERALARLDGWIWEDEARGARVTGARSLSWDTAFALQALSTVPDLDGVRAALGRGADFLSGHQIRASFDGFREAHRTDPRGGWCFAGKWHGWPVSDCTAEAVLGLVAAGPTAAASTALDDAARFMLRCQNRDGGFGSYEARRFPVGLEWLNPAEMFGESMTEHSYVECTASCLAALAAFAQRAPRAAGDEVARRIARGGDWLRRAQAADGSWRGVWGVQFIYGTMFGIRGLLAAGARPGDPALRQASAWLLDRQRPDGGWGEHHSGCLSGRFVPHETSQVIQTAWALTALLEADADWGAIVRGVRFLLDAQREDGTWPEQDMAGLFFRTALLDYDLYRSYFPHRAIGLYERRRRAMRPQAPARPAPPLARAPRAAASAAG